MNTKGHVIFLLDMLMKIKMNLFLNLNMNIKIKLIFFSLNKLKFQPRT